jgi:hypothetical protein
MCIADTADTYGNVPALGAVLGHIRATAPDQIVNLGDLVSGPFDPVGSADAQMQLGCATMRGNHDRRVVHIPTGCTDAAARALPASCHLAWLALAAVDAHARRRRSARLPRYPGVGRQ